MRVGPVESRAHASDASDASDVGDAIGCSVGQLFSFPRSWFSAALSAIGTPGALFAILGLPS